MADFILSFIEVTSENLFQDPVPDVEPAVQLPARGRPVDVRVAPAEGGRHPGRRDGTRQNDPGGQDLFLSLVVIPSSES